MFNDTNREICLTVFYLIQYKNNSVVQCLENVIHQIDRNEWLLRSAFQQIKFELGFVLTQENAFS